MWLNSYMPAAMGVWKANMDIQITIDLGKIEDYITKYVTKSEDGLTAGSVYAVRKVME